MTTHFFPNRLRLSLLWCALLAAVSSTLFIVPIIIFIPNLRDLALAAIPAYSLSNILFWWLFIVHSQQVTIVRGGLAGILSVVLALFLMWVISGIVSGQIFQAPVATLFLGVVTMVATSISPLGWFMMAIGGSIDALLAFFIRRWALNDMAEEGVPA